MNDDKQFKDKVEYMIMERMNESHAIEGFNMSIKLNKPKIEERCLQILVSGKFKELLYQSEKINRLSEDTFLKLMELHCEAKKKSEDPDEYLQSKVFSSIINEYMQQNFVDEKIRKEKAENYLKLLLIAVPDKTLRVLKNFMKIKLTKMKKF